VRWTPIDVQVVVTMLGALGAFALGCVFTTEVMRRSFARRLRAIAGAASAMGDAATKIDLVLALHRLAWRYADDGAADGPLAMTARATEIEASAHRKGGAR
jgi:hypothetical protein